MSKYTGEYLNAEICRAIGIDPNQVDRVVVDCKVGDAARVTTEGFVESDDGKIDRLKRVLRHYEIKPKGRYEMKNPFKRNQAPAQGHDPAKGKDHAAVITVKIDAQEAEAAFERMKAEVEMGQLSDLAKLGRYVRVEHFPEYVGPNHAPGKAPWVVTTNVDLHDAQWTRYGHKGVEIVNAVGLPECVGKVELVAEDNGRVVIPSVDPPTAQGIAAFVAHVEKHTTAILDEYRRFEAMGQVRKKVGK